LLRFEDVEAAARRIAPYVYRTPLEKSYHLSAPGRNVFLKLECQQPVRAFKIRGALNRLLLLGEDEKRSGVAAISSGNHGISVAYGGRLLGISRVKIIVPANTPASKIEKITSYGAELVLLGSNFDEAYAQGMDLIRESGLTYIDGWDKDPAVYAGQGTVGLEILEQNPSIDTILVPIGGGGLSTGIAVAVKARNRDIRVIPVCSEACTAWPDGVERGSCFHEYPNAPSVCEALVGGIGELAFSMRSLLDTGLVVRESSVRRALVHAVLKEKILAEASGAVAIAALLEQGEKIPGRNIALVISGGNVDNDLLIKELAEN